MYTRIAVIGFGEAVAVATTCTGDLAVPPPGARIVTLPVGVGGGGGVLTEMVAVAVLAGVDGQRRFHAAHGRLPRRLVVHVNAQVADGIGRVIRRHSRRYPHRSVVAGAAHW